MTLRSQCTLPICFFILAVLSAYGQASAPSGSLISNRAIAFNRSNGKVYVVDEEHSSVSVIETAGKTSHSVKVGAGPEALAVNVVTNRVYVANSAEGTVSVLDGNSDNVLATVKAGPHPYVLAANEDTNKVYVTNTFSDLVAVIDGVTNTASMLKLGSADNVMVNSRVNQIFLLGYEDVSIRVLDGAKNTVEKLTAREHLWGMALSKDSGELYVTAAGSNTLLVIDPISGQRVDIPVGSIPCAVAVNDSTNTVYVVNYGDNSVTVIDGGRRKVIATVKVGNGPQALAIDAAANLVYVANTHGNSVSVIDGVRKAAVATLPAGNNPFAITVTSKAGKIFTANMGQLSFTELFYSEAAAK